MTVFIVSTTPPEDFLLEMPVRAELAFMDCLEAWLALDQAYRDAASQGRACRKSFVPQPLLSGTAVMITTAWAIGGSSVSVMSRRAVIPAGVISFSRRNAPPASRIDG